MTSCDVTGVQNDEFQRQTASKLVRGSENVATCRSVIKLMQYIALNVADNAY